MEGVTENDHEKEKISNRLVRDFSFESEGFSDPIQWTDGVGFGRVRKLPDGYASLFKIGIGDEQLRTPSSRKSLWISASYGKETMGGITLASDEGNLSKPVDLDFRDEFYYDTISGKYYRGEEEITAAKLFQTIEEAHTRPTKPFQGFWVRCRLWFWRGLLPTSIKWFDIALVKLLWIVSGEKIKDNILRRLMGIRLEKPTERIPPNSVEFENSETMNFFGYRAKRWSVVFYSALHLGIFTIFFYFISIYPRWISTVLSNNFLATCYIVVSFAFTESFIPRLLKSIISKITPVAFETIAFKRLKI